MSELDARKRNAIPGKQFAFPKQRKEPLENAAHVRNAIARFNQVEGVGDDEREEAWKHIKAAARKFGVEVREKSWREVGAKATAKSSAKTAAKTTATKKTAAKKTPVKKAATTKTAAKKAPAKKSTKKS